MINLRFLLFFFLLFTNHLMIGQHKYWVYLSDKNDVQFNPYEYFDTKTIERRISTGYPLEHYTDLPLRQDYIYSIQQIVDTITGHTRWFNAIACIIDDEKVQIIKKLPFVSKVSPMVSNKKYCEFNNKLTKGEQSLLTGQTSWMQGDLFRKNKITGKGVRICVIDAGFPKVDIAPVFSHIRDSGRIIDTWDFHKNSPDVYKYSSHGTTVLSCVAGIYNEQSYKLQFTSL